MSTAAPHGHGHSAAVADELGVYTVTHSNAAVKADVLLDSPLVEHLAVGATVVVLELKVLAEEYRLRARLAEPAGWMTLRELRTNYCWATLLRPITAERARMISDVIAREQQLEMIHVRSERLRAEHQTHLNNFRDRVQELESRVLSAQLVPVDRAAPRPPVRALPNVLPMHLQGDRELHAQIPKPPSWPDGFRVVDTLEVELDGEMERAMAYYPPLPAPPLHELKQQRALGRIVTSNAAVMPSIHYAGLRPNGVYPISWPIGVNLDAELVNQVHAPFPAPDHYAYDFPGAWRFTEAGGCPLAVQRVELVTDAYGRGHHAHAVPVYVQAAGQAAAARA